MNHLVAHSLPGTLLFHDWVEAAMLWDALVVGLPGAAALCLLPNHVHGLHPTATAEDLRPVLSGFARARNARRGESGGVWERPIPDAEPIGGTDKVRRQERYVHLNPPRGKLAPCPLGWAFSTHRDAVGLAAFPVRKPARDVHEYHRYVSSDPSVAVQGTLLPTAPYGDPTVESVLHAVSAVARTPLSLLARRGRARTLLVRSLRTLTPASLAEIADLAQVSRSTVLRMRPGRDRAVNVVSAVVGDRRFGALLDEDLQHRWRGWSR